jgi:prolyl-tRNA editing enzyme YbaK/EbsC (Cys-tRNA(Pro) deacylase)
MTSTWPEPVERVSAFLRSAGAEARIEEFSTETPTAADAAAAVGCELQQIVKSLVLVADGRPLFVLVPGDRRVDVEKVRRVEGVAAARVARADEVKLWTGFAPGAVAPFGTQIERVLVERTLVGESLVWVGSGSESHLVALAPLELVRLTRAEVVDVVDDPTYHSSPDTDGKEP